MRLSFVLPAYKRRFLKEAVASLLAQTYRDFEIVVVDDCSPEDLQSVIDGFSDSRLKYIRNEVNLGGKNLVNNWNRCLELAQGEYCVLASDDDIYLPHYAEVMLALAAKHPEVDVLHCRTGVIDETGCLHKIGEKRPEFESFADLLYARGVKRCLQTAPEFMFKTAALKAAGGFVNFPLAWYSDDATWLLLAKEKGAVCSDEVLFHWRFSGINISSRFDVTEKKVLAAEQYKKWLGEVVSSVKPHSETDAFVLRQAFEQAVGAVDQQTLFDFDDTKLLPWFRMMRTMDLPRRLKLRSIRNRIRKIVHL